MPELALIFDCDGTLTDSMPLHYRAWRDTLAAHGLSLAEDHFYALAGVPSTKIVQDLARAAGLQLDFAAVAEEKEQMFYRHLDQLRPIDPIVEIVKQHYGHCSMAVASGGLRAVVERQLRLIGIHEMFAAIVTAEDTQRHKPEPDVFLEAARRLDVEPTICHVYEDSDLGLEAARRAGMTPIDIRPLIASVG